MRLSRKARQSTAPQSVPLKTFPNRSRSGNGNTRVRRKAATRCTWLGVPSVPTMATLASVTMLARSKRSDPLSMHQTGATLEAAENSFHAATNVAAITGPMTTPLRPKVATPPSVEVSTR